MPALEIRDAHGRELVAGCALVADSLGFSERDALPPWLVQTAAGAGGLALGAFSQGHVVGFSFALPTAAGELFSCGLAVDPAWRGRGVGRRLKLAQRDRAVGQGATVIRWTADPLAAPALTLYLGTLGARLVAYCAELYAEVRPAAIAPDDVMIEWPLREAAPLGPAVGRVQVPLERGRLADGELMRWRLEVRRQMTDLLARGGIGSGVEVDRSADRAWVAFRAAA
jgi:predicted GNAT superfamily acetyltransferase